MEFKISLIQQQTFRKQSIKKKNLQKYFCRSLCFLVRKQKGKGRGETGVRTYGEV